MAATPSAEVLKIGELVDYQNGSVVSRIVVKAETGNVTLFAFDAGQELSEHTAPFDALVHVLDGEAEITISGLLTGNHSIKAVYGGSTEFNGTTGILTQKILRPGTRVT